MDSGPTLLSLQQAHNEMSNAANLIPKPQNLAISPRCCQHHCKSSKRPISLEESAWKALDERVVHRVFRLPETSQVSPAHHHSPGSVNEVVILTIIIIVKSSRSVLKKPSNMFPAKSYQISYASPDSARRRLWSHSESNVTAKQEHSAEL